jgi:hypothetical protein
VGLLMRVTVCSWKKHDYIWSGGGWIFKSKNNLTCKRCHHGVHKTLDELQKSGPIKMK